MVLNGSELDTDANNDSEEAMTISQLLYSNTKKSRNKSSFSETPFSLYLGLMIHSKTRKRTHRRIINAWTERFLQTCIGVTKRKKPATV